MTYFFALSPRSIDDSRKCYRGSTAHMVGCAMVQVPSSCDFWSPRKQDFFKNRLFLKFQKRVAIIRNTIFSRGRILFRARNAFLPQEIIFFPWQNFFSSGTKFFSNAKKFDFFISTTAQQKSILTKEYELRVFTCPPLVATLLEEVPVRLLH